MDERTNREKWTDVILIPCVFAVFFVVGGDSRLNEILGSVVLILVTLGAWTGALTGVDHKELKRRREARVLLEGSNG